MYEVRHTHAAQANRRITNDRTAEPTKIGSCSTHQNEASAFEQEVLRRVERAHFPQPSVRRLPAHRVENGWRT